MTGINRMVGTPWHIERLERQEDDPRRHRSRCIYFRKVNKQCDKRNGKCIGSAHCMEYDETVSMDKQTSPTHFSSEKAVKSCDNFWKIGTKVLHSQYGKGEITKLDAKIMTIHFEYGFEKKFDIQMCVEKGFVKLEQ